MKTLYTQVYKLGLMWTNIIPWLHIARCFLAVLYKLLWCHWWPARCPQVLLHLLHPPLSQLVLSIPSRYLCPNRVTSFFGNNFINFSKCVVTKQDMYMHQSSSQITKIRFLLHNKIAASQIYKFQYVIHTGERHFFINGKLRFDDKLS